jgi:SecD/SecF fusion protein
MEPHTMFEACADCLLFAQTPEVAEKATEASGPSGWLILLILFVVFVLPFVAGTFIARLLKLKDLGNRIGVVLFAAVFGLAPFVWQYANGKGLTDAIKLGIDLAGGTNLVFQVDRAQADEMGKTVDARLMDNMVGAVMRRLDPAGQDQITVRRVGADRIEVIIPGADQETVERKKRQMTQLGSLEFAILANQRDHGTLIRQARESTKREIKVGTHVVAAWYPVAIDRQGILKDVNEHGEVTSRDLLDKNGKPVTDAAGKAVKEFLVIIDPPDKQVTGQYLTRAYTTNDQNASLAVGFTFSTKGGFLFEQLTSDNKPTKDGFKRRLAILLDKKIESAPDLNDVISTSGIISGRFDQEEINELINVLNAGALEVPIIKSPISEFSISPTLGADVQDKGKWAIGIAAGTVVIFMAGYYLFAGLVADLCLLLNLVLVMGIMSMIEATFTLPGLAGIVLTIGMAVDANVLIFERIREEQNRGSSLRMAIQNGFSRALTTIVDANVTTLITAVVLYMIGTDQVRGFGVTLFIGIVMSMFTALFFGRLVFDIFERKRWLTELKMFSVIGKTQWNFLSARAIAAAVSAVLILTGMVALFTRGGDNLDIDFSGGTMVTFEFVEPQDRQEILGVLREKLDSSISLENLFYLDEKDTGDEGIRFRLRTKMQKIDEVRAAVNEALTGTGHELRRVTVEMGPLAEISGNEAAGSDTAGDSPSDAADTGEEVVAADVDQEFIGGHQVALTFSDEIASTTVKDLFVLQLNQFKEQGQQKYDSPESLFVVEGTSGSGSEAEEGKTRTFLTMQLRTTSLIAMEDCQQALDGLQSTMAANPIFDEVNSFASSIAAEMRQSAVMAMLASLCAIVAYIWFRFQRITFGLAAVVALVHDVAVVAGMVALASYASETAIGKALLLDDFKINLPMIAAFLTIVGYSLNDTIVVFDRIREVRGKNPALTDDMVNTSLNQTLSRTILTSLTTFVVVGILFAIGGEGIHGFAFCLVLGVIVGTYSSIYVASPVLLWLMSRAEGGTTRSSVAAL